MAISLTESAATRVLDHLEQRGKGLGLRLGVKKTGCSGFAYVINYADEVGADDVVFEDRDVEIVVDLDSLPLIDGTQVDFVRQGLNEPFKFRNPNLKGESGCADSSLARHRVTLPRQPRAELRELIRADGGNPGEFLSGFGR